MARRDYEQRLRLNPTDPCAVAGLARLTEAERAAKDAAAAKEEKAQTWVQSIRATWDDWKKQYATPMGVLGAACASLLVLLLVFARLGTSVVVRPRTAGTIEWHRKLIWGLGLALILAASLSPFLVSSPATVGPTAAWPVVSFVATAVVLAHVWSPWRKKAEAANEQASRRHWRWVALPITAVGLVATAYLFLGTRNHVAWLGHSALAAGVAAALAGVTLVAFGRGVALGVRVQVFSTAGTADVSAGRLMVARLEGLGSHPPSGLRTAEGTDVTTLPEEALTSVPTGGFTAVLFNIIRLLRPAAPWGVEATFSSDDTVAVTATRNGRAVPEGARVISALNFPDAPEPAGGDKAEKPDEDVAKALTSDELLTGAAAHVLIVLSRTHTQIKTGMCGADTWTALAMHAVATRESTPSARRTKLLQRAVDASPDCLLARLALLNGMDQSDPGARRVYAEHVDALWDDFNKPLGGDVPFGVTINSPDKGYEATQLRMLFVRAVAWFNVRTDKVIATCATGIDHATAPLGRDPVAEAWGRSAAATLQLRHRHRELSKVNDPTLKTLLEQVKRPAAYVLLDLRSNTIVVNPTTDAQLSTVVKAVAAEVQTLAYLGAKPKRKPPKKPIDHPAEEAVADKAAEEASAEPVNGSTDEQPTEAAADKPTTDNAVASKAAASKAAAKKACAELKKALEALLETDLAARHRSDYYSLACLRAGRQGDAEAALEALELAATDERLRAYASMDPSLQVFTGIPTPGPKVDDGLVLRFKKLVADAPPESYLTLPLFKDHAEALQTYGLTDLDQLSVATTDELAAVAKVHPSVAHTWLDVARLHAVEVAPHYTAGEGLLVLQLLLGADIRTVEDLKSAVAKDREGFYMALVEKARAMPIALTRAKTIDVWQSPLRRMAGWVRDKVRSG